MEPIEKNATCDNKTRLNEIPSADDIGFLCYYYILFLTITVINLLGNSLVLFSSFRRQQLRTAENYFIISLASSDILHGLVYTIYNISHMEVVAVRQAFHNWGLCVFVVVLMCGMEMVSNYTMVAITGARYIAIVHPLFFPSKVNSRSCLVTIAICWVLSMSISLFLYARAESDTGYCGVCRYELMLSVYNIVAFTSFTVLLPLTAMFIMSIRMAIIARIQVRKMIAWKEVSYRGRDIQVRRRALAHELQPAKAVGLLLGCFAITYIPVVVFIFVSILHDDLYISRYIRGTVRILLHANSAVNVFIYAGRLTHYRNAFKEDLRYIFSRKWWSCRKSNCSTSLVLYRNSSHMNVSVVRAHRALERQ